MATKEQGVGYKLPEYEDMLPDWQLVADVTAGTRAVKEKGDEYLPWPVPKNVDASHENEERYAAYLQRAVFYAVTKRTLYGLTGEVFRKDPVIEYTDAGTMPMVVADLDGMGVTAVQHARRTLMDVLGKGRALLFVDYTSSDQGTVTRQDQITGGSRPTVVRYDAESIINWRSKAVGSENRLSLVVIHENHQLDTDDETFEPVIEERWKELRLTEDNVYIVRHWKWDEAREEFYQDGPTVTPTKANGTTFDFIPATFVGSMNNDPVVDQPPMLDLATLNIAHYINSADHEESVFICGQPTPWVSGLTEEWAKDIIGEQIQLGSRKLLPLPENGSAGMLQADPNTMVAEAMKHKEEQMVKLGAKLVEAVTVARTATDAMISEASENSILSTSAGNVSQAYTTAFAYVYEFLGLEFDPETTFMELSKDYEVHKLSAQEQQQLVASWMAGAITDSELRDNFRRAGIAFLDDEDWRAENEELILNKGLPQVTESDDEDDNDDNSED